jgi:zinc protease
MRSILLALLVTLTATAAFAGVTEEEKIFPFTYKKVELDNGFRAYLIEAKGSGQFAYITIVRTGSRDEWEPGHSGYAHLIEHLLFKGTEKYPDYDAVLTSIGASHNAGTSSDVTSYYVVGAGDTLETVFKLESDRFQNLDYSEALFKTETGALLGEYYQSRSNPFSILYETLKDTAFDNHTYKHTTIGLEADVIAMPTQYEYCLSFYSRYYRPENCVLLVAGDFDVEIAEEWVRKYYSDWAPGYIQPEITAEEPQTEARVREVTFKGQTLPLLNVAYKAPAWSATDKTAVATQILGTIAFGPTSEIYKRLVVKEQKVQNLNASFGLLRDPYLLTIGTMVKNPADVDEVRKAIEETAAKFRDELCDAKVLEDTKRNMKYGFLMGLETPLGIIYSLSGIVVNTGGIESVEDYYKTIMSITPEDVREAARLYFVDAAKTIIKLTSE